MKKVYYSTSLFKAKGRGEIYNNHNEKILEFENDLTWTSKKDIINLICGQPLDVGTYPTAKLKSSVLLGTVYFADKEVSPKTLAPAPSEKL